MSAPTLSERMAALEGALGTIADAVTTLAQASVAPVKGKSRGKVAKDARPMSERRAAAVGGECEIHGKRFATAAGARWHAENIAH